MSIAHHNLRACLINMMVHNGTIENETATCLVVNFGVQDYDGLMIGIATVMVTIIMVGNMLTLLVIRRTEELQTTTNKFISSLAASDLLVAVAVIFNIIGAVWNATSHDLLTWMCLITAIAFQMSTALSVSNLLLISVERYIYICIPMKYGYLMTNARTNALILISWASVLFISTVVSAIYMDHCNYCQPLTFLVCTQVLFGVVYLIMLSCYGAILRVALLHRKQIRCMSANTKQWTTSGMKLAKLMFSVMGIFSSFWIPVTVLFIVDAITGSEIISDYGHVAHFLAIANSGMNFFVYIAKDNKFRTAIVKLLQFKST